MELVSTIMSSSKSRLQEENEEDHLRPQEGPHQESQYNESSRTPEAFILRLLASLSHHGLLWGRRLILNASRILSEPRLHDLLQEAKLFLYNHPLAAVLVAFMTVACGVPVLIFVTFALITIFFTFSGFIIIEGAVLAAGCVALLVCLASMAVVFTAVGFVCGFIYIVFMHISNIIHMDSGTGEHVQPFDARLPQILACLRKLPPANHNSRHNRGRGLHSSASNGHTHLHHSK